MLYKQLCDHIKTIVTKLNSGITLRYIINKLIYLFSQMASMLTLVIYTH